MGVVVRWVIRHPLRARAERRSRWHRWFAWMPVGINGTAVWRETVERRRVECYAEAMTRDWEYRFFGDRRGGY